MTVFRDTKIMNQKAHVKLFIFIFYFSSKATAFTTSVCLSVFLQPFLLSKQIGALRIFMRGHGDSNWSITGQFGVNMIGVKGSLAQLFEMQWELGYLGYLGNYD